MSESFWTALEKLFAIKDHLRPFRQIDVVLAIGIDVSPDGTMASPQSEAVALTALEIFERGRVNNILLVGGYRSLLGGLTEAEAMRDVILAHAKDPEWVKAHLFLENRSYRTWLNAQYSLPIMQVNGWNSAIIVAQQWHARRVIWTFRRIWRKDDIEVYINKAWSPYGAEKNSQKRFEHFLKFLFWDSVAFVYSFFKFIW